MHVLVMQEARAHPFLVHFCSYQKSLFKTRLGDDTLSNDEGEYDFTQLQTCHTCFIVTAGLQSLSSSSSDKQTVPDGYTFG